MINLKTSVPIVFLALLAFCTGVTANNNAQNKNSAIKVLPLKQRAQIIDDITSKRIEQLLPRLMKQTNIDMWVLISREYNEDPVLKTLLPATWMSARRTTMFVFVRDEQSVKALAIAPYNVGKLFERAWDKESHPNQWQALAELMQQ